MTEFVVVFARQAGIIAGRILVILKDRPAWQRGRLNLVGGHVEEGETPVQAAVRELKEESGLLPAASSSVMGAIFGDWGTVWVVKVPVFGTTLKPREQETEKVFWIDWSELRDDPRLISNLKVIIPLCMSGVKDWAIRDECEDKELRDMEIYLNG